MERLEMARGTPDWSFPYAMWGGEARRLTYSDNVAVLTEETIIEGTGKGQIVGGFILSYTTGEGVTDRIRLYIDDQLMYSRTYGQMKAYGQHLHASFGMVLNYYSAAEEAFCVSLERFWTFSSSFAFKFYNSDAAIVTAVEASVVYELMVV